MYLYVPNYRCTATLPHLFPCSISHITPHLKNSIYLFIHINNIIAPPEHYLYKTPFNMFLSLCYGCLKNYIVKFLNKFKEKKNNNNNNNLYIVKYSFFRNSFILHPT